MPYVTPRPASAERMPPGSPKSRGKLTAIDSSGMPGMRSASCSCVCAITRPEQASSVSAQATSSAAARAQAGRPAMAARKSQWRPPARHPNPSCKAARPGRACDPFPRARTEQKFARFAGPQAAGPCRGARRESNARCCPLCDLQGTRCRDSPRKQASHVSAPGLSRCTPKPLAIYLGVSAGAGHGAGRGERAWQKRRSSRRRVPTRSS